MLLSLHMSVAKSLLHTEVVSPQEDYAVAVSLSLPVWHAHIDVFDLVLIMFHQYHTIFCNCTHVQGHFYMCEE